MGATSTQTRAAEFREALANRVLVADGAMGTMLYQKGVFINRCYDELNLTWRIERQRPNLPASESEPPRTQP
jgi:hypothetical protein